MQVYIFNGKDAEQTFAALLEMMGEPEHSPRPDWEGDPANLSPKPEWEKLPTPTPPIAAMARDSRGSVQVGGVSEERGGAEFWGEAAGQADAGRGRVGDAAEDGAADERPHPSGEGSERGEGDAGREGAAALPASQVGVPNAHTPDEMGGSRQTPSPGSGRPPISPGSAALDDELWLARDLARERWMLSR